MAPTGPMSGSTAVLTYSISCTSSDEPPNYDQFSTRMFRAFLAIGHNRVCNPVKSTCCLVMIVCCRCICTANTDTHPQPTEQLLLHVDETCQPRGTTECRKGIVRNFFVKNDNSNDECCVVYDFQHVNIYIEHGFKTTHKRTKLPMIMPHKSCSLLLPSHAFLGTEMKQFTKISQEKVRSI
jgi:hypothetical protein